MNADERLRYHERISALADGQLSGAEFAAAVELTAVDDDARDTWHLYHMVGEVLRAGESGASRRDRDFLDRLNARLKAEPDAQRAVMGSQKLGEGIAVEVQPAPENGPQRSKSAEAANDGSFRWKLVAGFASLAAVAAISWSTSGLLRDAPESARLALSGTAPASEVRPLRPAGATETLPAAPVMIRDRELDALIAAHRQAGGGSALQNPSGFLRNATFAGAYR